MNVPVSVISPTKSCCMPAVARAVNDAPPETCVRIVFSFPIDGILRDGDAPPHQHIGVMLFEARLGHLESGNYRDSDDDDAHDEE
ncbi:MAG: hypothetical protein R2834_04415 [Rhodothermales bacterium]